MISGCWHFVVKSVCFASALISLWASPLIVISNSCHSILIPFILACLTSCVCEIVVSCRLPCLFGFSVVCVGCSCFPGTSSTLRTSTQPQILTFGSIPRSSCAILSCCLLTVIIRIPHHLTTILDFCLPSIIVFSLFVYLFSLKNHNSLLFPVLPSPSRHRTISPTWKQRAPTHSRTLCITV